ncbi:MAG: energy-coupling factor ABC transporter permease [Candidatus Aureabacteria bacterium]|nr:energy-coupling factor ABC transporter permease [Candidatus Auribacterota bacterium]
MHIPDGFLAARVWAPSWAVAVAGMWCCLKRAGRTLGDRAIPLMGVTAAFIFAAQMLNFPVAGGTSGHLLGGVLAAVLLGPWAGAVVIAIVLAVQCLLFQDGGLTALGANVVNMALIGSAFSYGIYILIASGSPGRGRLLASVAAASWCSVFLASTVCAFELALSDTSPLRVALPAMAAVHALIGIVEALITCGVISFIVKVRPDLLYAGKGGAR